MIKRIRRIRLNDLDGYKAKEKAINDVTCLKGLVRTFYDFNEHFSGSTFTAHKNQYKLCEKNSTDWLQFENRYLVDAYDKKVRGNYALALEEMDSFMVILEGVSMYFAPEELLELLSSLAHHFTSVSLLMDCYSQSVLQRYRNIKIPFMWWV